MPDNLPNLQKNLFINDCLTDEKLKTESYNSMLPTFTSTNRNNTRNNTGSKDGSCKNLNNQKVLTEPSLNSYLNNVFEQSAPTNIKTSQMFENLMGITPNK